MKTCRLLICIAAICFQLAIESKIKDSSAQTEMYCIWSQLKALSAGLSEANGLRSVSQEPLGFYSTAQHSTARHSIYRKPLG